MCKSVSCSTGMTSKKNNDQSGSPKVKFWSNKAVYTIDIEENVLYVTCVKKTNVFDPRSLSALNHAIPLNDVIGVTFSSSQWQINSKADSLRTVKVGDFLPAADICHVLTISYIQHVKGGCWQLRSLKFNTFDKTSCSHWCSIINEAVMEVMKQNGCHRPKSLLVFVNPFGGTHKAVQIHRETVSPIFNLAGIKQRVVITEYQNHAKKFIESEDLSSYDGIIAVGGDGMLHEVINGILIRTQAEHGIALDKDKTTLIEESQLIKPHIRIGVIPAGSTNCLSYVSQGVDDAETAALHIAVGDSHPLDLCSIHDRHGRFQKFSFSMTSFGFYGNVLNKSENMRMLGPSRYDFAGIGAFIKQRAYRMEIWYLPSFDRIDNSVFSGTSRCRYPCQTCNGQVCTKENMEKRGVIKPLGSVCTASSIKSNAAQQLNTEGINSSVLDASSCVSCDSGKSETSQSATVKDIASESIAARSNTQNSSGWQVCTVDWVVKSCASVKATFFIIYVQAFSLSLPTGKIGNHLSLKLVSI